MIRLLLLALLLALLVPGGAAFADERPAWVHESLRYRLELPAENWRLMDAEEAAALAPEATGGAVRFRGASPLRGVVVVEDAPGIDLQTLAELVVEGEQLLESEPIRFRDLDAMRVQSVARYGGQEWYFVRVIFVHGELAWHLGAWGPARLTTLADAQPFFDAFHLLPGDPVLTDPVLPHQVAAGTGWRLGDGRFESVAAGGLVVETTGRWRISAGRELAAHNPGVLVGLSHPQPAVKALIDAYPDPDGTVASALEGEWAEAYEGAALPSWEASFHGEPLTFQRQALTDQGYEVRHALLRRPGHVVQVEIWVPMARSEAADPLVLEALQQVRFLEGDAAEALQAELRQAGPRNAAAGVGYSVRGSTVLNFPLGFRWSAPFGLWEVLAGDEARLMAEEAEVFAWSRELGLSVMVYGLYTEHRNRRALHRDVVAMTWIEGQIERGRTRNVEAAGLKWRVTTLRAGHLTVEHATLLHEGRAFELILSGHHANMAAACEILGPVLAGLRLDDDLEPVRMDGATLVDARLGFRIDGPPGWALTERPVPVEVGVWWMWQHQGRSVSMMAIPSIEGVEPMLLSALTEQMGLVPVHDVQVRLAGHPARHIVWGGPEPLETWMVWRDDILYLLLTESPADEAQRATVESLRLLP